MGATSESSVSVKGCAKTRQTLIWINLLNEPLTAFYTLLPFILAKDLGASAFQLSLFVALRPLLSMFSFFWGANLKQRNHHLVKNMMGASLLAYLPFLLFSLTDNVWLLLLAAGFYQLFHKAGLPAWIEILKRNIPKKTREDVFSFSFLLSFIESGILGLMAGFLLDENPALFKGLLFVSSLLGLSGLLFLRKIPIDNPENITVIKERTPIWQPIKESLSLLKERQDFRWFQLAFMIGGSALMLMAPALPLFYTHVLSLSHTEITMARFVFMAIGVVGSTFLWKRGLQKSNINALASWVLFGFGAFPLLLLISQFQGVFLYLAFFIYGIAQAGSHLIWNLSGTLFAKGQSSSPFTSVNLLMIGFRGMIFPFIGAILCQGLGQNAILCIGMIACIFGGFYMRRLLKLKNSFSKASVKG